MSQINKLLVVDDEKVLREALIKGLSDDSWVVLEADTGKRGLQIALESRPDLILLDIVMPDMDGITMLQQLRQDEWGKKAKVVFLTNLEDPAKAEEANRLGALGYFVKTNWKISDLLDLIKTHI